VNPKEMSSVLGKALKIARASSMVKGKEWVFGAAPSAVDKYRTVISVDPFGIPAERKLDLLMKADEIMRRNKKVKISEAFMGSYKTEKTFASTEGSHIEQEIVECGAGISATAIDSGEIQVRSYPNSFRGNFATRGMSGLKGWPSWIMLNGWLKKQENFFQQTPVLRRSPTLILDSSQLALQIHESVATRLSSIESLEPRPVMRAPALSGWR